MNLTFRFTFSRICILLLLLCLLPFQRLHSDSHWKKADGLQFLSTPAFAGNQAGFKSLPPQLTQMRFVNTVPEYRHLKNQILLNGSGLAAGDIDGDGLCDLYFCRSEGSNALYKNLGGLKFRDITREAQVECSRLTSTGATLADIDGDQDLDLLVNTLGQGTHVFVNDGMGRFQPSPEILNQGKGGMTSALADVNADGFLDLYIANYRTSGLMDIPNARVTFKRVDNRQVIATLDGKSTDTPELRHRFHVGPDGHIQELGELDAFYLNDQGNGWKRVRFLDGSFLDSSGTPLREAPFDWGLTAMFRDMNRDGLPDLYVCNDFETPDRVWINIGQNRFQAMDALSLRRTSKFSMAVDFSDINRDGLDDFFVLDMLSRDLEERMRFMREPIPRSSDANDPKDRPQYSSNTFQLNRGGLHFSEIAQYSGIDASDWSWTCSFLDVDLDGYEDLLVGNGVQRAARDMDVIEYLRKQRERGRMSDRQIFELRRMFPRLITANLAFRNTGSLTFSDVGEAWGFDLKQITTGMILADLDNDGDLDVVLNNFNTLATVYENLSTAPRIQFRLVAKGANTHAVGARITVTSDGMPDQSQEIISGGKYLSSDQPIRTFAVATPKALVDVMIEWPDNTISKHAQLSANRIYRIHQEQTETTNPSNISDTDPSPSLFMVWNQAFEEDPDANLPDGISLQQWKLDQKPPKAIDEATQSSTGPMALADIDADGDLDLFSGGETPPGKHPLSAPSRIFLNRDGQFIYSPAWSSPLQSTGLVKGAVFTDVDGDGDPDLALACEWSPVRLFLNHEGHWIDATQPWGLDAYPGWWQSIDSGDFNNDGKIDLVVSNLGLNQSYQSLESDEISLYFGDWNRDGRLETIEAYADSSGTDHPISNLTQLKTLFPFIHETFSTHRSFATATVEDVLGAHYPDYQKRLARWPASTVFLNQGKTFKAVPLPMEAQWSSGFGIASGDFNLDGNSDIALAQNIFPVEPSSPRSDSGQGLILLGNGDGTFKALSQEESGIRNSREQQTVALEDIDHDGKLDLAFKQTGGRVQVHRNQSSPSGIRVHVFASEANPFGIGASIRLGHEGKWGPLHEIHAGSGYLAQHGSTIVLPQRPVPFTLKVRLPWKDEESFVIKKPGREIRITPNQSVSIGD
ncbi:MAG TPA: hypothetical protein EYQ50_17735 [Verrucomicrobiales bacterium]|nr:hypothetical protein [Verrucomicrobiales bacterium]